MTSLVNFKEKLLTGLTLPLNIKNVHQGTAKGDLKVILNSDTMMSTLIIDDLIDRPTNKLSYMILNADLNIKTISGVGMIVQNDGIIRYDRMVLKYYERTKQYMLSVNLHDKIEVDRVLIVFDFKLNLDNISTITNIVKPIPIELPEDGSMSRPGN